MVFRCPFAGMAAAVLGVTARLCFVLLLQVPICPFSTCCLFSHAPKDYLMCFVFCTCIQGGNRVLIYNATKRFYFLGPPELQEKEVVSALKCHRVGHHNISWIDN